MEGFNQKNDIVNNWSFFNDLATDVIKKFQDAPITITKHELLSSNYEQNK